MKIEPIGYFHSPLTSKFGIPRQSGLATDLPGRVVLVPEYRREEAVRGLDGFDYLWLIWEFSVNRANKFEHSENRANKSRRSAALPSTRGPEGGLTVRPPRLGGNERVGVFASRSPFRPNNLGLSCVRIDHVEMTRDEGPVIHVLGADLMDGTPIYDIKPYVAYADAHPEARSGFVDQHDWQPLTVEVPGDLARQFTADNYRALCEVLAQDPRPRYHDDPTRIYGMPFAGHDVKFRVADGTVHVVGVE